LSIELFLVILNGEREYDDYFETIVLVTLDSPLTKKCSTTIRHLAYGVAGDLNDDYMRMSEYTCHEDMSQKLCMVETSITGLKLF
jgi:hypothetical protein